MQLSVMTDRVMDSALFAVIFFRHAHHYRPLGQYQIVQLWVYKYMVVILAVSLVNAR